LRSIKEDKNLETENYVKRIFGLGELLEREKVDGHGTSSDQNINTGKIPTSGGTGIAENWTKLESSKTWDLKRWRSKQSANAPSPLSLTLAGMCSFQISHSANP
jgi:hypothetical protein